MNNKTTEITTKKEAWNPLRILSITLYVYLIYKVFIVFVFARNILFRRASVCLLCTVLNWLDKKHTEKRAIWVVIFFCIGFSIVFKPTNNNSKNRYGNDLMNEKDLIMKLRPGGKIWYKSSTVQSANERLKFIAFYADDFEWSPMPTHDRQRGDFVNSSDNLTCNFCATSSNLAKFSNFAPLISQFHTRFVRRKCSYLFIDNLQLAL